MAKTFSELHHFVLAVSKLTTPEAILQKTADYCSRDVGATTAEVIMDKAVAPKVKANHVSFAITYKKRVEGYIVLGFDKKYSLKSEDEQKINVYAAVASLAVRKVKRQEQALHLEEAKKLFISLMSHEIRTPLTSIYGYAQLLGKSTDNLTDNQKRWVQSLYFETARMTTMIEELLQLYQLQNDTFEIFKQKASVKEIIEASAKRFKLLYPDISLQVNNPLPASACILGDSLKLTQVFTNLLANAAKFSQGETDIELNVSENKHSFIIAVVDKGEGMNQEEFEKLLHILQDSSDLARISKGLSLYMAKEIVSAHDGSITIHTQKNKGTTITVKLPKN